MTDILISEPEYQLGFVKYKRELSDVIKSLDNTNLKELPDNTEKGDSVVEAFGGNFYAIKKKIEEEGIFDTYKNKSHYIRCASSYFSCNAVLNLMYDSQIEAINSADTKKYSNMRLRTSDVHTSSDRRLMYNVLGKIKDYISYSEGPTLRYKTYNFFEYLKHLSIKGFVGKKHAQAKEDLKLLNIHAPGFNYREVRKKHIAQNNGNGAGNGNGNGNKTPVYVDAQPLEPPEHTPKESAHVKYVVGNDDVMNKIQHYITRLCWYDSETESNTMSGKYPENIMLFGHQGVGKNFTIDAVLNWIIPEVDNCGKNVRLVNMRNLGSIYKDGSRQILQKYYAYEKEHKDTIFINLMDEFDSILSKGSNGQMSEEGKKLIGDFKSLFGDGKGDGHIMTIAVTNYTGENDVEPAIRDRFKLMYVPGPQTHDDFAKLLWNESRVKSIALAEKIQWYNLGKLIETYSKDCHVSGRDCESIAQSVHDLMDNTSSLGNTVKGIGMSPQLQKQLISGIFEPATNKMYIKAIHQHFYQKKKANSHRLNEKEPELDEVAA